MQALQKRTAQNTMKNAIAPKQTVRAPVSALPKLVPAVAPVSRARCTTEIRRLASAIVLQATGNGSSATQETTTKPLPIVFVAAECAPWSKTGGLGDVLGGLPIELAKRGHKVITIAPRYDQYSDAWDTSVVVKIDGEDVRFFHSVKKGVHRVWVDHPWFLAKVWGKTGSKLYGPASGADYIDNHKRFALFNKAAIEAVRALPFGPGEEVLFVANDWHTALLPVLLKDVYQPLGQFQKAKVALCIHNIAFQGRMWEDTFKETGLPQSSFAKLAFSDGQPKVYTEKDPLLEEDKGVVGKGPFKKVNWLKAGILACDKLLTVSPNYAAEIASDESGGVELDTFIREKGGAEGIVNGMDVEEWDPRADKYLVVKYDKTNVTAGKAAAKEALQADVGLPVDPSAPLFSFIGRLEEQKGVDILLAAIPKALAKAPNAQIVILGTGKAKFEKLVNAIDKQFKGRAKGVVKFSAPLAHLITAGADFILVPSRFEPCGLIQLHAMQYGTVPVVASTGGLVDTVKEGVTGFHMGALDKDTLLPEDADALATTVARAAEVFATPLYREMVYNCISQDLSWSKPALKWEGILESLFYGTGEAKTAGEAKAAAVKIPVKEPIPGPVAATDKPLTRPVPKTVANGVSYSRAAAAPASASSSAATSGLQATATPSAAGRSAPTSPPTTTPTTVAAPPKVSVVPTPTTAAPATAASNGASATNGASADGATATPATTTTPATATKTPATVGTKA